MEKYRNLILRASRNLGSRLIELGLLTEEQLDVAYEKLLEAMKIGDLRQSCLLKVLMYDIEAFTDAALLEQAKYPLINLDGFEIQDPKELGIDQREYWSTWSVVFDTEEDFFFVATAYDQCEPVIKYWEEKLKGKIIWYSTNLKSITAALQKLPEEEAKNEEKTQPAKAN